MVQTKGHHASNSYLLGDYINKEVWWTKLVVELVEVYIFIIMDWMKVHSIMLVHVYKLGLVWGMGSSHLSWIWDQQVGTCYEGWIPHFSIGSENYNMGFVTKSWISHNCLKLKIDLMYSFKWNKQIKYLLFYIGWKIEINIYCSINLWKVESCPKLCNIDSTPPLSVSVCFNRV